MRMNVDLELGVIQDMESTLLPDNHTVKTRGVWLMDGDTKTLFYESCAVADLQHELSLARERIALLEQTEQLLLKRIKKLKNKSELDDGFIDHLRADKEDSQ